MSPEPSLPTLFEAKLAEFFLDPAAFLKVKPRLLLKGDRNLVVIPFFTATTGLLFSSLNSGLPIFLVSLSFFEKLTFRMQFTGGF